MTRQGFFQKPQAAAVTLGAAPCKLLAQNATYIKCVVPQNSMFQVQPVAVRVHGRGLARSSAANFTYDLSVARMQNTRGVSSFNDF